MGDIPVMSHKPYYHKQILKSSFKLCLYDIEAPKAV